MKLNDNYVMTKLDEDKYVAFPVIDDPKEYNEALTFNETGASIWKAIQNGADTKEKIVNQLMKQYEDAERSIVQEDVSYFLEAISIALTE